jgi:hypothetical protein
VVVRHSFDFSTLAEFFKQVESLREFEEAMAYSQWSFRVGYEAAEPGDRGGSR